MKKILFSIIFYGSTLLAAETDINSSYKFFLKKIVICSENVFQMALKDFQEKNKNKELSVCEAERLAQFYIDLNERLKNITAEQKTCIDTSEKNISDTETINVHGHHCEIM